MFALSEAGRGSSLLALNLVLAGLPSLAAATHSQTVEINHSRSIAS